MIFPICITLDNRYLIACATADVDKYITMTNVLSYETSLKTYIEDNKVLRHVKVHKLPKGYILTVDMADSSGEIYKAFKGEEIVNINVDLNGLVLEDKESLYNVLLEQNDIVAELEDFQPTLRTLSAEIYRDSKDFEEMGCPREPFISSATLSIVYDLPEGMDYHQFLIDTSVAKTSNPSDRVFLPIATTEDIVRANETDIKPDNVLVKVGVTSEFMSPAEYDDYIAQNIRLSEDDLVLKQTTDYINQWYGIIKTFSRTSLSPDEQSKRIELAKLTNNSIYREGNMRELGIALEPGSENYNLIYGKFDTDNIIHENEMDFYYALRNLLQSVLLYQHGYYSPYQLTKDKGGDLKSTWFDSYVINQIKYILIDMYGFTGKVIATTNVDNYNEEDDEDSDIEDVVDAASQMYKIVKSLTGDFNIVQATEMEMEKSFKEHTLDTSAGLNSIKWFIRDNAESDGAIRALIQLIRFGERKCQYLKISDTDNSKYPYFNTKTLNPEQTLVVEKPYTVIPDKDNKDMVVAGGLFIHESVTDLDMQLPIGVVLLQKESNGINERERYIIYDTNRFLNMLFKTSNDKPLLSLTGLDYKDGKYIIDIPHFNDKIMNNKFYSSDLQSKINSTETIIDPRCSKKQNENIAVFCKKANTEVPQISSNKYTLLSAFSSLESHDFSVRENPEEVLQRSKEQYINLNIVNMILKLLLKNQKILRADGKPVEIGTMINFAYMKATDDVPTTIQDKGVNFFDTVLQTPAKYKIVTHAVIHNESKEIVGYAFQVVSTDKEQFLLVSSKQEIGMRMPINPTDTYKVLQLSKLLDKRNIKAFYNAGDLEKQIELVRESEKVVLASVSTIKQLRGD